MEKVKIKDIAQALGVSTATVSMVLSPKSHVGRVGAELAQRIKDTAQSMGYQPNLLAQSLKSGKSRMIGLVIADITNPFFSILCYHVQKEMATYGYTVIIVNTDEDKEQMQSLVSQLVTRQVDGLLIAPTEDGEDSIKGLQSSGMPFVMVDRYYPDLEVCSVLSDAYTGTRRATEHLLELGYTKIGFLSYKSKLMQIQNRFLGYRDAMREAGVFDQALVEIVDRASISTEIPVAMEAMFEKTPQLDALVCAANNVALHTIKSLSLKGKALGVDVQLMSFDKSDYYNFVSSGKIGYVEQPIEQIAKLACEILLQQIQGECPPTKTHLLECKYNFNNQK